MAGGNGERLRLVRVGSNEQPRCDETYVILGSGRDYEDVAPVTGTYFGPSPESLLVSVEVKRLD